MLFKSDCAALEVATTGEIVEVVAGDLFGSAAPSIAEAGVDTGIGVETPEVKFDVVEGEVVSAILKLPNYK